MGRRNRKSSEFDSLDTTILDGIPITSVAQTLLDVSAVWVSDGDKLVEVDFVWRELGLIVEVDGSRYHRTRWRRRQDNAKTAALQAQGWTVLRFSDVEINGTPALVAATTLTAMSGLSNSE